MKRMRLDVLALMIAVICVLSGHAGPLPDSSAAIEAALGYSGLGPHIKPADKRALCITAELKSVSDPALPLVSGKSVDSAWCVRIDSIQLRESGPCTSIVGFEVLLEKESGALLMAKTIKDIDSTYRTPQPQWSSVLSEFSSAGYTVLGFPKEAPTISIQEASFSSYGARPCHAEEGVYYLVQVQHKDDEPFPCWVVIGRSVSPIVISQRENIPPKCNLACWLNATTGRPLFMGGIE